MLDRALMAKLFANKHESDIGKHLFAVYSWRHSSYYGINGGKVDLINQLPARASPFLSMTEATSMAGDGNPASH